jgi:hypothetical protein
MAAPNPTSLTSSTVRTPDEQSLDFLTRLIHELKADQMMIQEGIAPEDVREFWMKLSRQTTFDTMMQVRSGAQELLIRELVIAYLAELGNRIPKKLAFDLSNSEVRVWAEVDDDNEAAWDELIMAAAKVNATFTKSGLSLVTMIVESGDGLPVPSHYQLWN